MEGSHQQRLVWVGAGGEIHSVHSFFEREKTHRELLHLHAGQRYITPDVHIAWILRPAQQRQAGPGRARVGMGRQGQRPQAMGPGAGVGALTRPTLTSPVT